MSCTSATPLVHSIELLEILEYLEALDPDLGPYFRCDLENALAGLPHNELVLELAMSHQNFFRTTYFPSCIWAGVYAWYGCPA